ncbi:hypothetical protein SPFL3102_02418 [Sporomusaceae bacterium FL31]|nr:hypothetical protein SPFL3101_02166 [Sporomusaceae bacterium FL31]GCE34601.1 hypothetical protein SPFL3102_02418 [Sporomusaceae bacterium]
MQKKPVSKWYEEDDDDMMMDEHDMMEKSVAGLPRNMMLAHAYVLYQCYNKAFCPSEALMKGTLFPELWGVYPIPR